MSLQFPSEQFADFRADARFLVERARDQEDHTEALLASAEHDVRHAEAAVSQTTHLCIDELRNLLRAQLLRSLEGAETARQLCVGAHRQHVAARRLAAHLDGDHRAGEARAERDPRRAAVLVVDDYGDVRDVVASVLRTAGFVVRTAANGLEAVIAAYAMRPAVIVMDLSMPVLDGIEATRLIKATEATRHARVIAYTGNAALDDSVIRQLFVAVLRKPATPDAVLATVQHVASL